MSEDKDPNISEKNENSPENGVPSTDAPIEEKVEPTSADQALASPIPSEEKPQAEPTSEPPTPEVSDENWQDVLAEDMKNIPKEELKKRKEELKKQAKAKKQAEMDAKTRQLLDQQFTSIFNPRVLPYTIFFFLIIASTGILTLLNSRVEGITGILWIQITITLCAIVGYLLLFNLSRIKSVHETIFAEGKSFVKILLLVFCFIIAFLLIWLYWTVTESGVEPAVVNFIPMNPNWFIQLPQALRYTVLFGTILQVIYFGWNIIQILFIRIGLENISVKAQTAFEKRTITVDYSSKAKKAGIYNVLIAIVPYLLIPLTVWLLLIAPDTPEFWAGFEPLFEKFESFDYPAFIASQTGKFTPTIFYYDAWYENAILVNPEVNIFNYFVDVWWGTEALRIIFLWYLVVTGLMIAMTVHQKHLLNESKIHKTPNIFSNLFFMLLWIILWTKSFSILKGLLTIGGNTILEKPLTNLDLFIDLAMDFLLMVITLILAMRGFGLKFTKGNFKGVTQYNASLMALVFAISYFGGQMVLIATGLSRQDLGFITNLIVLVVDVVFYFWYSKFVMERKGFTRRTSFTLYETKDLLVDLSMQIKEHMLQTIENEEIITSVLNNFLLEKKIALEHAEAGGKDGVVGDLVRPEEELTAEEKLERATDAYKVSRIDKDNFDKAVENLTKAREELTQMKVKEAELQKVLNSFPSDLEANCDQSKQALSESQNKVNQIKSEISEGQNKISQLESQIKKVMNPPAPAPNADGSIPPAPIVDQDEVNRLNEEKSEKQRLIETLTVQMNNTQTQIQKQSAIFDELNQKVTDLNNTRNAIKEIHSSIENAEKQIQVMETDLVVLEKREIESRPKLAAAEGAKMTAEEENNAFNETQKRIVLLDEAKFKQGQAEEKLAISDRQMKDADARLNATTPIPQCEEMIRVAKEKISTRTKIVGDTQATLIKKQGLVEEKTQRYNIAKEDRDGVKIEYEAAAGKVMLAEKELEKAQSKMQSGENLKKELDDAKVRSNETDKFKQKLEKPETIEAKLQESQNKEKEQKVIAKEVKRKADAGEGPQEEAIRANELLDKIREEIGQLKQKQTETKEAYANYDIAMKKVKSLEEKQIDLKVAKTELDIAQKNLKVAQDAAKAPKTKLDEKETIFVRCSEELNLAKSDADAEQGRLNQARIDLQDAENEKLDAEQALADRQKAEAQHLAAMKDLEKSQKVLENAKKFVATREFELNEAKEIQKIKEENAEVDWKIYLAHVELREAQKTFQEALRSAEANLKARESRLQDAIEVKRKMLELRQASSEPSTPDSTQ